MNTFPTVQKETLKLIGLLRIIEEELACGEGYLIQSPRMDLIEDTQKMLRGAMGNLIEFADLSDAIDFGGLGDAMEHEEEAVARVGQKVIDKEGGKGIIEDLCAEYAVVRHGTKIRKVPWDRIALSAVVPPPSL